MTASTLKTRDEAPKKHEHIPSRSEETNLASQERESRLNFLLSGLEGFLMEEEESNASRDTCAGHDPKP
ncbi:MAG: hypothetical protein DMF68_11740 [Acidobacteria bacterium]|nr:MAG: hypothetical protein DMF68_11740 [Acidobacteriota bacterium]